VVLATIGCRSADPSASPQLASYSVPGLAEPTPASSVNALVTPPDGWVLEPQKSSATHVHLTWISPSTRTAYGVIHFTLPLPVGADIALWGFMREMQRTEGEGTLRSKTRDADLPGVRFVAEGGRYTVRVNLVTPVLFARYPDAEAYAGADRAELEEIIRSTGFFRAKSESLIRLGQALVERFDGEVPNRLEDLVTLPGVGRKTANVVLGNAFGIPGITVDTHVGRLSRRLGWTTEEDPVKVEHAIGELVERREWTMLSHRLIFHGRRTCFAKRPACGACPVARDCPSFGIGEVDPAKAARMVKP